MDELDEMDQYLVKFFGPFRLFCSWSLIAIAVFGIPVNILPFWILSRKRRRSMFHNLILILSVSDLVRLCLCLLNPAKAGIFRVHKSRILVVLKLILPWDFGKQRRLDVKAFSSSYWQGPKITFSLESCISNFVLVFATRSQWKSLGPRAHHHQHFANF